MKVGLLKVVWLKVGLLKVVWLKVEGWFVEGCLVEGCLVEGCLVAGCLVERDGRSRSVGSADRPAFSDRVAFWPRLIG
ncbi:MAG: hypothetical protein F6K53_01400 [Moorea sp. SIO4A1]|nr:hypothetical protein [Moorena sp. SIO4A1]